MADEEVTVPMEAIYRPRVGKMNRSRSVVWLLPLDLIRRSVWVKRRKVNRRIPIVWTGRRKVKGKEEILARRPHEKRDGSDEKTIR